MTALITFNSSTLNLMKMKAPDELAKFTHAINIGGDYSLGSLSIDRKQWINEALEKYFLTYDEEEREYVRASLTDGFERFDALLDNEEEFILFYSDTPCEYCGMLVINDLLYKAGKSIRYCNVSEILRLKMTIDLETKEQVLECLHSNRTGDSLALVHQFEQLAAENTGLRIYKDGKIMSVSEDYFDHYIQEVLSKSTKSKKKKVIKIAIDSKELISSEYEYALNINYLCLRTQILLSSNEDLYQ